MFKPTDENYHWASLVLSFEASNIFPGWGKPSAPYRCITNRDKFLEWKMMSRKDALENMRSFFPSLQKSSYSEGVTIVVSAGLYTPHLNLEIKKLPNLDTGWIKCSHPRKVPEPIKVWAEKEHNERIFDHILDRDDPYHPSRYAVWEKHPKRVSNVYVAIANRISWFTWVPHRIRRIGKTFTPTILDSGYLAAGIELPHLSGSDERIKIKAWLALLSYKNQLNKGIPDYSLDKVLREPAPRPSKFKAYADEFDKYSQPTRGVLERMVPSVGFVEDEGLDEIFEPSINLFGSLYPVPRDMVYRQALRVVERMLKDLTKEE